MMLTFRYDVLDVIVNEGNTGTNKHRAFGCTYRESKGLISRSVRCRDFVQMIKYVSQEVLLV